MKKMTDRSENVSVEKLMRMVFIQTGVLFLGTLAMLLPAAGFYAIITFYAIIPFFLLFILLNIAYNENSVWLLRGVVLCHVLIYFAAAIFFTYCFVNLFFMAIISSALVAYSYVRYVKGRFRDYVRALIPSLVAYMQIIVMVFYEHKSVFNSNNGLNVSLFFASILLVNFSMIILVKRWWQILIVSCVVLVLSSYYMYGIFTPIVTFLTYLLGSLLVYFVNMLLVGWRANFRYNRLFTPNDIRIWKQ